MPSIADPSIYGRQMTLPKVPEVIHSISTLVSLSIPKLEILDSHMPSIYLPEETSSSTHYRLSYANNNTHPGPSLKSTQVKIQVFKYSYPDGFRTITTDVDQRFSLGDELIPSLAVEVISVKGQNKYNLRCFGGSLPGKLDVVIRCQRRP